MRILSVLARTALFACGLGLIVLVEVEWPSSLPVLFTDPEPMPATVAQSGAPPLVGSAVASDSLPPEAVPAKPIPVAAPAPAPVPPKPRAEVTGTGVNVRSGPGSKFSVVDQIDAGQTLEMLGREGGWVRVALPGGGEGFIFARLLRITDDGPATQEAALPTR